MEIIEHFAPAGAARQAPQAAPSGLQRLLQNAWVPRAILLCSLGLTLLAVWAARGYAERDHARQFEHHADVVHKHIANRMAAHENLLRGGVALFTSTNTVSRDAWHRYVDALGLRQSHPGTQGLGVARWLAPADRQAREAAARAEGFASYRIWPPATGAEAGAVLYLEPEDQRNLRTMGFDMMSEGVRREAMERARDTGRTAMTGLVHLMQDGNQSGHPGFLIYLPVYRDAEGRFNAHGTADSLWGWVYAPFRFGELMSALLNELDVQLALQLEDVPAGPSGPPTVLLRSGGDDDPGGARALVRSLHFGGREWRITYREPASGSAAGNVLAASVAAAGVAINLLLFQIMRLQSRRRREAERQVSDSLAQAQSRRRWLDAVSGLSPDGALVFECDGSGEHRLMFTNPAFSRLFDLRPDDLLGLSETAVDEWLAGLGREDDPVPPLGPAAVTLTLPGPPLRVLSRTQREDGPQRVYYFSDVTHETELDRLKSEFITTAAHELRTPLASVFGYTELLANRMVPEVRLHQVIDVVYRQAGVLKHLVDELMDVARLDARGDADFGREPQALRPLLETAIESVSDPAQPPRIRLTAPTEGLWALADATKLRQALVNALSNAFKFSPAGSSVSVILRRAAGSESIAAIQVIDQGLGMTDEECARAFERFYRADPSGHVLGAGLGLSIAKEIVELHGGRIELRSRPGAGTTVTMLLPLVPPPLPAAPPQAGAPETEPSEALTS
jgi:signal transduction histidine kinase